jgi:hypothetical protein
MSQAPVKKLKRPLRNIKVVGQESPTERQARTAVRYIMDNNYYNLILKAIRDGVPNQKIAEAGIGRGWFDQTQKTVVSYLQYFRKHQPGLCRPQPKGDDMNNPANLGFDDLFDGNATILDEEVELLRLIKLQQARLGIGFRNERNIGALLASNRREVQELRNLIMDLAKLRGVVTDNMNVNMIGYNPNVVEDLKGIQQEEGQRNVIAALVKDLVGLGRHE